MFDVRTPGALRKAMVGSVAPEAVLADEGGTAGCRTVLVRGTERLRNDMVLDRVFKSESKMSTLRGGG